MRGGGCLKIVAISDTHDNVVNIKDFLKDLRKIKANVLIHCGDICAPFLLKNIVKNFKHKILISLGNNDGAVYELMKMNKEFKNINIFYPIGTFKTENVSIAFTHYPEIARALAFSKDFDIVFYGHTHKAKVEKIGNCLVVNPGSLHGTYEEAKYVICDLKKKKIRFEVL